MPAPAAKRRTKPAASGLEPVELFLVSRALFSADPTSIDEATLGAIYGGRVVRTHAEVGKAFGVAKSTVSTNWSPDSMPGREGNYSLLEIAQWRIGRNRRNSASRASIGGTDRELERRQLEAETRKVELQSEKLEMEMQIALGNLIDRPSAATAIKSMLAVTANHLLNIPRDVAPGIPTELAPRLTAEIERHVRRVLTLLAEKCGRVILSEASDLESKLTASNGAARNGS